jgi:predicted porin
MSVKKMVIAVGLAALSSSIHAQSNLQVQLYGIADAGLEFLNHVPVAGGGTDNVTLLSSGNVQASRFGLRGNEDLGGGLSAIFTLENGFSLDNGTLGNGGRLFGRQAWVGLKGAYGQLLVGRTMNVLFDFGTAFDPFSGMRYSTTTYDLSYAGRADNALKYMGTYGNLNLRAQYSFGYDGVRGIGEVPGAYKAGKEMGVNTTYDFANFRIGATYDRQNGASVAAQHDKDVRYAIGAAADFKPVKVYAAYQRRTVDVGATSTDIDFSWVGAMYSATPALLLGANLYWHDPEGASNRSSMLVLYGSYSLSKRTALYTTAGLAKNQLRAKVGPGGTVNPGDRQTGLTAGIRHVF